MIGKSSVGILVLLVAGCGVEFPHDRSYVAQGIEDRTGHELGPPAKPGEFSLPAGVCLEDGLSDGEAVTLGLWNNAQFQADLASLGFARADLIEANMLPNPNFSLLFPVGPKLLEMKLNLPMEVLWQRPRRIAAAKVDAQSVSENLIEHGLGLIRDVQTTYTDLWLAREQARLAREEAQLRVEIDALAQSRLRAGDISELAASATHVDSLRAQDAVSHFSRETLILKQRLRALLGFGLDGRDFEVTPEEAAPQTAASVDELLKTALASRPDLRAAELKIEAAGERIGWEKSKVYNFIAIIDGKDKGEPSLTIGPGFQVEIPILNQNNGRIARAKAELEQAARQYEAVRQSIILQVREAYTLHTSAYKEFDLWHSEIVPSIEKAGEQAQRSYETGDVSYLLVLEVRQRLFEARLRQTELAAQVRRSAAMLNYCIGTKVI